MDSNQEEVSLSVEGFHFYTEKDAQLARTEKQRIEYLEERIDYSAPESILYVYEKSIHERLFRTPVGIGYLRKLRDFLLAQPEIDSERVADIPLYMAFDGELREQTSPARTRVAPSKKRDRDKEKERFLISVILNVALVCTVIAMFVISFLSEQPNIVNYERALTSKYASWEQELTEREQVIRQRELELKLDVE